MLLDRQIGEPISVGRFHGGFHGLIQGLFSMELIYRKPRIYIPPNMGFLSADVPSLGLTALTKSDTVTQLRSGFAIRGMNQDYHMVWVLVDLVGK